VAGARQIVDPPAFSPLPYGLWDATQVRSADSPHWQNGVTWAERCPDGGTTYDECLVNNEIGESPGAPGPKTDNVSQTFRGAQPFTVYAEFDCSPVGLSDAATVAADALSRVEQQQIETAFWTGTAETVTTVFPHLAANAEVLDAQDIVLQTAATPCVTGADAAQALGELEDCLADCYPGQGLIHIPRSVLPTLAAWNLVTERDGRLYTTAGNLIVVGGGYTGSGPDGTAPADGTAWIYATGAVFGYRGDVQVRSPRESIDRSANTMRMIAERTYVLGFECCLLAAHIVLGVPTE
jgi:hypothetical protein